MRNFLEKIIGTENDRQLAKYRLIVAKINSFEETIKELSDEELTAKTGEFKSRLEKGETLDDILPEAFAVVREVAVRTLDKRHFDVQLLGGIAMHKGNISEMRTGEGKTLVATLPLYLNALTGRGAHLVTVNDYLARRDAVWMGQVYAFLGLSVGVISSENSYLYDETARVSDEERDQVGSYKIVTDFLRPCERHAAYMADITYGTNSEFGFDYLRDHIERDATKVRQREFHYAVVDEIDSILIDEARTPLIISAPVSQSESLYTTFAGIAAQLEKDKDFEVDEKRKAISLTDEGITKAEKALGIENIYTEGGVKYVHHLETAVRAKALFHNDKEYVVRDGEIMIVDEFTGRIQPGRRWSDGLHQAIEAKEGVKIKDESRTFASITYQNFFRLYDRLSGMTGTANTSAEEFKKVYGLGTIEVPTNKPVARVDRNDLIFKTEIGKFKAIARKVKELHEKGQPVLIGTVSIEKNELLSDFLKKQGVPHEILNAKNHEREGQIIAQAGRKGAVTIATNMAGRGVDIRLGGAQASEAESDEIRNLGGLFVLGTERHEARRIDNQLRGRSGRQGDPGETQFFVSLEDSLMRVFASDMIKGLMDRLGVAEDEPIENKIITRSIEKAQERIEGFNFDARKHVLEFDDVLNTQRSAIYESRHKILFADHDYLEEFLQECLDAVTDELRTKAQNKRNEINEQKEFLNLLRAVALQAIDMHWVDHLEAMTYLRDSVSLRAYGQRDPLVEYKREGLHMFRIMNEAIKADIVTVLGNITVKDAEEVSAEQNAPQATVTGADYSGVGRNDPCPCGSGKKFKKCHGK